RPAIGTSRIGRGSSPLKLNFPCLTVIFPFAQSDGPAVAKLAGPIPELVARVAGRVGMHTFGNFLSCEDLDLFLSRLCNTHFGSEIFCPREKGGFAYRAGEGFAV